MDQQRLTLWKVTGNPRRFGITLGEIFEVLKLVVSQNDRPDEDEQSGMAFRVILIAYEISHQWNVPEEWDRLT